MQRNRASGGSGVESNDYLERLWVADPTAAQAHVRRFAH